MRELFQTLIELDPAAKDSLLVIEYFDRLVSADISVTGALKEAALLSRAEVGYERKGRRRRFMRSGDEAAGTAPPKEAIGTSISNTGTVWMLIDEHSAPSAPIVLERLALAITIIEHRAEGEPARVSAVETLLSTSRQEQEQDPNAYATAIGRLRLESNGRFRAIATPMSVTPPSGWPHALIDTQDGPIRGVIVRDGARWAGAGGVGTCVEARELHASWKHAVIALKLSDGQQPFEADSLGALLAALGEYSGPVQVAEIERIEHAMKHHWTLTELEAIADGKSLRGIASVAGLHHSTIQERLMRLPDVLTYEINDAVGKARLLTGVLLTRIARSREKDWYRPNV